MRFWRTITASVTLAVLASMTVETTAAMAAPRWPGKPVGVQVAEVGSDSVLITAGRSRNTKRYYVYYSTSRPNLAKRRLSRAKVVSSSAPSIRLQNLPAMSGPLYWRFATAKGRKKRFSKRGAVYLKPSVPTDVRLTSDPGLSLMWRSPIVTRFEVLQSTSAEMDADVVSYSVDGIVNQFSPPALEAGRQYYFLVRSYHGSSPGPWSAQVSGLARTSSVPVRLMTYNILVRSTDGRLRGSRVIAPWLPSRRDAAAELVMSAAPDVIAIQEGSQYTGPTWESPRQVDSLAQAMGPEWTVAHTQDLYFEPNYRLTGSHIVFRNTVLAADIPGGHWHLGNGKYAAFQLLRHQESGARFLVVSMHLTTQQSLTDSEATRRADEQRRVETQRLVDLARAYSAGKGGVPIVYAGDTGSVRTRSHPNDAPGAVMRSVATADAVTVARSTVNGQFASVNQYRAAPLEGLSVDRVFASPGVGVRTWGQELRLTSTGAFAGVLPSDHNPVYVDLEVPVGHS